ncbi:uncharacterized protein BDV17DRAFT_270157 [Aspergillus undulatus]|uniref:uncharacterized protein n=1 Tax=Aspergillus undulatus TaxID=1810928 RepID=UPI003CCD0BAA
MTSALASTSDTSTSPVGAMSTSYLICCPRSSRTVFNHADIVPRNIMIDDDGKITGIVDIQKLQAGILITGSMRRS